MAPCTVCLDGADLVSFKAMDCVTGEIVAMKKFKPSQSEDGIPSTTIREISVLRSLDHPNIVKLFLV